MSNIPQSQFWKGNFWLKLVKACLLPVFLKFFRNILISRAREGKSDEFFLCETHPPFVWSTFWGERMIENSPRCFEANLLKKIHCIQGELGDFKFQKGRKIYCVYLYVFSHLCAFLGIFWFVKVIIEWKSTITRDWEILDAFCIELLPALILRRHFLENFEAL